MRLARFRGERLDLWHPLLELIALVVVAEPFRRGDALALPHVAVTPMEPDHRKVLRSSGRDRRHRRVEPLRHIDAHEREVALLEERQRLLDVAFLHPALVPELD